MVPYLLQISYFVLISIILHIQLKLLHLHSEKGIVSSGLAKEVKINSTVSHGLHGWVKEGSRREENQVSKTQMFGYLLYLHHYLEMLARARYLLNIDVVWISMQWKD